MSVFFAENEPEITTLLNGMQPNDFRTPVVIDTSHGINYYKCNKCNTVFTDNTCITVSRNHNVYKCPKCKETYYIP